MIEPEDFINELFKKQRQARVEYARLMNPRKDNNETCMFCSCNDNCIKSHSISRNVLETISDNNEVIMPIIEPCDLGNNYFELEKAGKPNIEFKRKNIASAGTYRGFCEKHDNAIFQTLDDYGIKTQRDIFLQLYRTICKYFFWNKNVEKSEWNTFRQYYYANPEYERKIFLSITELKDFLEDMLIDFPELDTSIPDTENSFIIEPYSNSFEKKSLILYRRIPKDFDFAIENNLILKINNKISHCIFVILPGKTYSNLLAISSVEVIRLLHSHLYSKIQILNTIESIMMQDSQFYLKPEIIENWNQEKKKIVIDDFFFITERKFLQEYDVSIFDDLRKKLIENESISIKEHELQKINLLPERPRFQDRYIIYRNKTIKDRQDKIRFTGNKDGKNYPIGALIVE